LPFVVRALYANCSDVQGHLDFKQFDLLEVTDVSDPEWWFAKKLSGGSF
jgi:hypothetical protein